MEKFNVAKYSKVIYLFNPSSKYYSQTVIERQETPVNRLPDELRIAPVGASQIKPNADTILLSRLINGKYSFRTGLQKTYFEGWSLGNDFEYVNGSKVISLILIHWRKDPERLELFYFHRFDKPKSSMRLQFAHAVIPHLLKPDTVNNGEYRQG